MNKKLVLASTSPYRKQLLEKLQIPFEAYAPLCDEEELKKSFSGTNERLCAFLAQKKAESLKDKLQDSVIVGSDQSLLFQGKQLGKGKNFSGAFQQLKELSGQEALLITAVCIASDTQTTHFECNTQLKFKTLSDEEIEGYLNIDKPFDCAGSFKMECSGPLLFEYAKSEDPTAIQGLPLMKLSLHLKNF